MATYERVDLYADFTVGGKTYYEDSLHKPRFPAPADVYDTAPGLGGALFTYNNVTPRKGHELDEIELPISIEEFDVLLPGQKPKVICL